MDIPAGYSYREALLELKKDAQLVSRQAERLIAMKPDRMASYEAQLKATMVVINGEAEKLLRRKK